MAPNPRNVLVSSCSKIPERNVNGGFDTAARGVIAPYLGLTMVERYPMLRLACSGPRKEKVRVLRNRKSGSTSAVPKNHSMSCEAKQGPGRAAPTWRQGPVGIASLFDKVVSRRRATEKYRRAWETGHGDGTYQEADGAQVAMMTARGQWAVRARVDLGCAPRPRRSQSRVRSGPWGSPACMEAPTPT